MFLATDPPTAFKHVSVKELNYCSFTVSKAAVCKSSYAFCIQFAFMCEKKEKDTFL